MKARLLAAALALAAVGAAHTHAGGQSVAGPASVPLQNARGFVTCRAARFDGGAYAAAHCDGKRRVNGTPAASSVDPTRDLRHFDAMPAPGVGLRRASIGDVLTWQNDRGGGTVTVTATGQPDGTFAFAFRDGCTATFGESGTGLYGGDGALVGVLVSLEFTAAPKTPTGLGWAVQVP